MVMTTMTSRSHIRVYARERIITLIWDEVVMVVRENPPKKGGVLLNQQEIER